MAKPLGMLKRGNTYTLRKRVPQELVPIIGKKMLWKSLDTADYETACQRYPYYWADLSAQIDEARLHLAHEQNNKKPMDALQEPELIHLAWSWLDEYEKKSKEREIKKSGLYNPQNCEDAAKEFHNYEIDLRHALKINDYSEAYEIAVSLLNQRGFKIDHDHPAFKKLAYFLTRANLEYCRRVRAGCEGKLPGVAFDKLFQGAGYLGEYVSSSLGAASGAPRKRISLGQLIEKFENDPDRSSIAGKTRMTHKAKYAVLKELLGADTLISEIQREECLQVRETLKKTPAHRRQKFKGMSIAQSIEANKKRNLPVMNEATVNTYMNVLTTLMNYAKRYRLVDYNPAEQTGIKRTTSPKEGWEPFSKEALNILFCSSRYKNYLKDKKNVVQAVKAIKAPGLFWIPLIGLLLGARPNEICQLEVPDVLTYDGLECIWFRKEGLSGLKHLKNDASQRVVPIPQALKKMGFMEYVKIRRDSGETFLFPDMTISEQGYFSDNFSKKFNRELKVLGIKQDRISFRSFRHNFSDAMEYGGVPPHIIDALGGWTPSGSQNVRQQVYGLRYKPQLTAEWVDKAEYTGLNLSHLYA